MSDRVRPLVRYRAVIALVAAVALGGAAFARARGVETHLEAEVAVPVGGAEHRLFDVVLRVRGGGEVTDLHASSDDPRVSFHRPDVPRVGPGEGVHLRFDVTGGTAPVALRIVYRNPEPRHLDLEVGR